MVRWATNLLVNEGETPKEPKGVGGKDLHAC